MTILETVLVFRERKPMALFFFSFIRDSSNLKFYQESAYVMLITEWGDFIEQSWQNRAAVHGEEMVSAPACAVRRELSCREGVVCPTGRHRGQSKPGRRPPAGLLGASSPCGTPRVPGSHAPEERGTAGIGPIPCVLWR